MFHRLINETPGSKSNNNNNNSNNSLHPRSQQQLQLISTIESRLSEGSISGNVRNKLIQYANMKASRPGSRHAASSLHLDAPDDTWASSSDDDPAEQQHNSTVASSNHNVGKDDDDDEHNQQQPTAADTLRQEFTKQLKEHLAKVSRQRLRYTLTLLRRQGGADGRVTQTDFTKVLQECEVVFPTRAIQLLFEAFGGQDGVNYEGMWIALNEIHSQTNRDSVRARRDGKARNRRPMVSGSEVFGGGDGDNSAINFVERAEDQHLLEQLVKNFTIALQSNDYLFSEFRDALVDAQRQRVGGNSEALSEFQIMQVVTRLRLPIKEQLLQQLLKRCGQTAANSQASSRRGSRTILISVNEFLQFLEKAYNMAMREFSLISKRTQQEKERVQQLIREADADVDQQQQQQAEKAASAAGGPPTDSADVAQSLAKDYNAPASDGEHNALAVVST